MRVDFFHQIQVLKNKVTTFWYKTEWAL